MTDEDKTDRSLVVFERIENKIYSLRGQKVMLDSDLAKIYGVTTRRLNEQVRRNLDRFPQDFMFQLTETEVEAMRSQIATASKRNVRFRPYAFSEHGAVMLATILNSSTAVEASLQVVRAFVRLRTILLEHRDLAQKIEQLEQKFGEHDQKFDTVFAALRQLLQSTPENKRQIGFTAKENSKSEKNAKTK